MVNWSRKRVLAAGICIGMMLAGCAGFAYRYYDLVGARYEEGKLKGPSADLDLDFSLCAPTAQDPHPCVVMFYNGPTGFAALKLDYNDCKMRLEHYEKTCPSQ